MTSRQLPPLGDHPFDREMLRATGREPIILIDDEFERRVDRLHAGRMCRACSALLVALAIVFASGLLMSPAGERIKSALSDIAFGDPV